MKYNYVLYVLYEYNVERDPDTRPTCCVSKSILRLSLFFFLTTDTPFHINNSMVGVGWFEVLFYVYNVYEMPM